MSTWMILSCASLRRSALVVALGFTALAQAQEIGREAWYAVPDARGVQVIHIECGADFIDPREIVVEPGVPVELSVRSSEVAEEFVSGLAPNLAVGKQPRKKAFTPQARGKHDLLCRKQGASAKDVHPRKRGLLHVGHPHGKPPGR
jgi:hypothetical protein